jgi:regulator of protease activity HflC (stomatin/prohibitin superfamily)
MLTGMMQMGMGPAMVPKATIYEYERGLLFHRGSFLRELAPGYYNFWWSKKYGIVKVDLRPKSFVIASQEILTLDAIPIRISLAVTTSVEDVRRNLESAQQPAESLYTDVQILLREEVAALSLDQVLADRQSLSSALLERAAGAAAKYAMRVESLSVRDISMSGDIKKAYGDVLKARKSGEAMLERARGETAALRNLANAARLISDQPELMQLRALQALAESPGSSLVLGADALSVRGKGSEASLKKGPKSEPDSE